MQYVSFYIPFYTLGHDHTVYLGRNTLSSSLVTYLLLTLKAFIQIWVCKESSDSSIIVITDCY